MPNAPIHHPRVTLSATLAICLLVSLMTGVIRAEEPVIDPVALYGDDVYYTIFRNGKRVGKHHIGFNSAGDNLTVKVDSNIKVTVLRIPVYRLRYLAEEQWQGGKLLAATADTRENREKTRVSMNTQGDQSILTNRTGEQLSMPALHYASNHWHQGVVNADRVFNTLTGVADELSIQALGSSAFETGSGTVDARHYRYSGAVEADVWYDEDGRWLGMRFAAEDDSTIVYRADF